MQSKNNGFSQIMMIVINHSKNLCFLILKLILPLMQAALLAKKDL